MREITTEEAQEFASSNGLFFLETSALDNSDQMIEKVFGTLTENIIKQKEEDKEDDDQDEIGGSGQRVQLRDAKPQATEAPKKKKCC